MADKTRISWTDATWNPTRGCTKVAPGCKNCYAERFAERFRGVKGHPFEQGFDLRLVREALGLPLRWHKPRRIFVNSMSDLFHPDVPDEFVLQVFDVIRRCLTERPGHVFQLLTKRPRRMQDFCSRLRFDNTRDADGLYLSSTAAVDGFAPPGDGFAVVRVLRNLWTGISASTQKDLDEGVPILLYTPAAHRFLSLEPLIEPIELGLLTLRAAGPELYTRAEYIRWVIVGGESGPGARPCNADWIRSIVEQCKAAGVPIFVKQIQLNGRLSKDPAEWPEDLRMQEFPEMRP